MTAPRETDYVLGTHADEVARLGLQHRVWRSVVTECWERVGLTNGWRVIDVGAGPGYATADLAEIVGPGFAVFVEMLNLTLRKRAKSVVKLHNPPPAI